MTIPFFNKIIFLKRSSARKEPAASDVDKVITEALRPVTCFYRVLIQPWMGGWLLHCYNWNDCHVTTVGGPTLEMCVEKAVSFYHEKNKPKA